MRLNRLLSSLAAAAALLLSAPSAFAQANSGHPGSEGCWCGYQTGVVRNYVVRGTGSTASHKEAAADMLREWNRYVNLFNVSVDSSSNLGSQNSVNEVNVFITSAESEARYGIELESSIFGVAVMFPDASFGRFNQCKDFSPTGCGPLNETDVVVNAAFPTGWTGDWYATGNDSRGGTAMVQATVLHEVGHTLGLHHVFDLAAGAGYGNSLSTMNYLNDDVGKYVTRIDSKTVRTEYPGAARSLVDLAILPFVYGNKQYASTYASVSKTSVLQGEGLTVSNWLIQNVGSQPTGSVRITFYLVPTGGRKYPMPSDRAIGNVDLGSFNLDSERLMNGTPLVVPASVPAGDYWLGAIATAGGQEDSAYQAGKPNNNRFLVGHEAPTVIRVLQGSGGGTPLAADFQFGPTSPQAGQTVSFQDLSRGGPTGWSWNFGDTASGGSNTSTARNPDHTFSQAGTYTVGLTVSATGATPSSTTRQVVVAAKPGTGSSSVALLVPVVLDLPGRFSSELTLSNSGTRNASVRLRYTAAPAFGGVGSGVTPAFTLAAGRQQVIPDVMTFLRQKGVPIPTGSSQGGTLRVEFEGLSNAGAGYASARTTAPIAGVGRAGLSYPGIDVTKAYTEPVAIFGLRQNSTDRSNLALVNASTTSPVTLTVYVITGEGTLLGGFDPVTLQPGQWSQYDNILSQASPGLADGWIIVDPETAGVPFLAYGVFNDGAVPRVATDDGSFVPAVTDSKVDALLGIPAIVEIGSKYSSELILTNLTDTPAEAYFEFVESFAHPGGASAGVFYLPLEPFEQAILPDIVDQLREVQAGNVIGPKGAAYAGPLTVLFVADDQLVPGLAGVRTSSPSTTTPGRFGLFYAGSPFTESARDAWIYSLQQNSTTRTNLAIVNAAVTNSPIRVRLEIFNGDTGLLATRTDLGFYQPNEWRQIDRVLSTYAPGVTNGYARLTVTEGDGAFLAYGVNNDGPAPNTGTSDGSYVAMVVSQ